MMNLQSDSVKAHILKADALILVRAPNIIDFNLQSCIDFQFGFHFYIPNHHDQGKFLDV